MHIKLPQLSLVVLIGPSGSGKSTFAAKHFLPTEVLSSDVCRGLVSDDTNAQAATNDAFDVLNFIASKRLAAGRLTVVDATNVQPEARKGFVALARKFHVTFARRRSTPSSAKKNTWVHERSLWLRKISIRRGHDLGSRKMKMASS